MPLKIHLIAPLIAILFLTVACPDPVPPDDDDLVVDNKATTIDILPTLDAARLQLAILEVSADLNTPSENSGLVEGARVRELLEAQGSFLDFKIDPCKPTSYLSALNFGGDPLTFITPKPKPKPRPSPCPEGGGYFPLFVPAGDIRLALPPGKFEVRFLREKKLIAKTGEGISDGPTGFARKLNVIDRGSFKGEVEVEVYFGDKILERVPLNLIPAGRK